MAFEDRLHPLEVQIQDLSETFGVDGLTEARRPLEIAEHDRDRAADLLSNGLGSERCPAHPAHAEAIGIFLPAVRADLHSRSLPTRGRDPPPNVTGTCLSSEHDRAAEEEAAGIEALPGRNRPRGGSSPPCADGP